MVVPQPYNGAWLYGSPALALNSRPMCWTLYSSCLLLVIWTTGLNAVPVTKTYQHSSKFRSVTSRDAYVECKHGTMGGFVAFCSERF
jgi:hypothetical protein